MTQLRRIPLPSDGSSLPEEDAGKPRIVVRRARHKPEQVARPAPSLRIVLEGEERYVVDGRVYRLRDGQMMLVPPGAPIEVRADGPVRSVALEMAPADLAAALPGPVLLPLVSHDVGAWLDDIARRLAHMPESASDAASAGLRDLAAKIAGLADDCRGRMARSEAARPATQLELLSRVEAARAYLLANLDRNVPTWELAEAARLSPFHLSRAFQSLCGASPAAYHRALRMDVARTRIEAGSRPAQVARELGFSSQASFTRAFRRHHGHPPGGRPDQAFGLHPYG